MIAKSPQDDWRKYDIAEPGTLGKYWWLFLVGYLVIIAVASWPVKVIFAALMIMNGVAVLIGHRRQQGFFLGPETARFQFGFGPSLMLKYGEIRDVSKASGRPGLIVRAYTALVRTRDPSFEPLDRAVVVRLANWRWVLFFTPIPFGCPTKSLRVPAVDPDALVDDLRARIAERLSPESDQI